MQYAYYGRDSMASSVASFSALCVLINLCTISEQLLLEPAGELYVCPGGGMRIRCSTSAAATLLEWSVTLSDPGSIEAKTSSFERADNQTAKSIFVNSAILNISRSFPLVSEIFTDNATADINGVLITCTEYVSLIDTDGTSASTRLISNNGRDVIQNMSLNVNISREFEADRVRVGLEWTHKNGVSYAIRVDPEVNISYSWRKSAQLAVSYNTKYNISVTASLCGRNRTAFTIIKYARCPRVTTDNPVRVVTGYSDPALEGTTVMFSCPTGLILTGSSMSTCMEDGEWEPDLEGIKCKVDCGIPMLNSNVSLNYSSTLEDSQLTFQCEYGLFPDGLFSSRCYRNGSWIPNPSGHVCATFLAANCGDPFPPSDGYLEPYTSTIEGARVNRVHVCQNGQVEIEEIVCNSDGQWEISRSNACTTKPNSNSESTATVSIISGTLGSLLVVALLVCGILVVVIVILRKKVLSAGIAISSSEEQKSGQMKGKNPEYEEVVMPSRNEAAHNIAQEDLDMMQNVAYGPLKFQR